MANYGIKLLLLYEKMIKKLLKKLSETKNKTHKKYIYVEYSKITETNEYSKLLEWPLVIPTNEFVWKKARKQKMIVY